MARASRVAVFVDGSNFFYLQKEKLGWWVDPKKLLDYIEQEFDSLDDAAYFVARNEDDPASMNYLHALMAMDYRVITKPLRVYNGTYRGVNIEIEVVLDIMKNINNFDTCIIVSGSADYVSTINCLRSMGKNVFVMSTQGFVSNEIRQSCGMNFIDFNDIRSEVEKESNRKDEIKSAVGQ